MLSGKGIVTGEEVRKAVEAMDAKGGMRYGARLVARAWLDPSFKDRLLQDANKAAAELSIPTSNWTPQPAPVPHLFAPLCLPPRPPPTCLPLHSQEVRRLRGGGGLKGKKVITDLRVCDGRIRTRVLLPPPSNHDSLAEHEGTLLLV